MLLFIQCLVLCIIFTLAILPAQYRDPLSQFASYPAAIRKRVYELPEYKDYINKTERKNWMHKIVGAVLIAVILAILAFCSGNRTFQTAFIHIFILFLSVNLYDLIILDLIIFCHSRKLMIPGTEDMRKEYRDPRHHIIGAVKGCAIGIVVATVAASIVSLMEILV